MAAQEEAIRQERLIVSIEAEKPALCLYRTSHTCLLAATLWVELTCQLEEATLYLQDSAVHHAQS